MKTIVSVLILAGLFSPTFAKADTATITNPTYRQDMNEMADLSSQLAESIADRKTYIAKGKKSKSGGVHIRLVKAKSRKVAKY